MPTQLRVQGDVLLWASREELRVCDLTKDPPAVLMQNSEQVPAAGEPGLDPGVVSRIESGRFARVYSDLTQWEPEDCRSEIAVFGLDLSEATRFEAP